LLAAPEERVLGQQLAAGRQAQARLRALQEAGQSIPSATGAHLLAQVQVARQARRRLILACAPLVEGLARQYSGYGVPREDLVQDGWVGVVRAAATFDPAKGPYFSRHAAWGARKAILDALTSRSRLIRLPAGVVDAIHQISAACHQWEQTEVDPPSIAALAQMTGLPPARVQQVLGVMDPPLSLDAPSTPASDQCLTITVSDERAAPLESSGLAAGQRQEVWTAVGDLDPLARQVVVHRFGLVDGVPHTRDEVALLLRLPEAEIHALEAGALDTLRSRLTAAATWPA
jgi:RNA polymerase primary sigma factor